MKSRSYLRALSLALSSLTLFLALSSPISAQQQVKVYPATIRLDKGKTRTITAIALDSSGGYMPNQTFTFSRATGNAATASVRRSPEGDTESNNSRFSKNLGEISGLASGQATFIATLNGVNSNAVTVNVVDPADAPLSVIRGDNEAENNTTIRARVGEAIEVNAENSQGVKVTEWFWGDGDRTSDLISATHAYLAAGTYQLKLRITNSTGQVAESTVSVIITNHPPPTRTFTVTTAAALLAAYNQCTGGEEIVIPAGTVITGHMELPARNFSDFVTIRSSAVMPDMAVRVSPTQTDLVTFRGSFANESPLLIKNRASRIRLSGIKFDPYNGSSDTVPNYYLLEIGQAFGQTTIADNPSRIILDHCVVNPPNNIQVVHAILNDGYKVSIIASWLGNIKTFGSQDSQAIFGLDGKGAHVYNNTYFEAASESIIYGGAGNQIDGLVPTNIEFRRCVFTKPLSWRGLRNSAGDSINEKNLFETKNARRVYVEGSLFSNHWDALRSQYNSITMKSASDYPGGGQGSPWAVSEEFVFENNRVSHVNGGVAVVRDFYRPGLVYDALKPQHMRFVNMLFDDHTFGRWGVDRSWVFYMAGVDDLSVKHITVVDANETIDETHEMLLRLNSVTSFRPEIMDSILPLNYYGIGNTCGDGMAAMNVGTSGWFDQATGSSCGATSGPNAGTWKIAGNVFPKMRSSHSANAYPANNLYPANYTATGMQAYRNCGSSASADPCDANISDFALRGDSLYKNKATDGTDPGINSALLTERVRCTTSGDTRTCITGAGGPPPPPPPTPTPTPVPPVTPTPTPIPVPSVTPTPAPSTGPFPGPAAARMPAIIEAENFDRGGEGIGYHEVFGPTGSGAYRSQPVEGVDIQARASASGGFAVMEAAAGEWLAYSATVTGGGKYDLGVRYASEFRDGTFHVEIDGQNVTGPVPVVPTANWATFRTTFRRVTVPMGAHTIRLVMDTNSVNPQTGTVSPVVANFDSIIIRPAGHDFDSDGKTNISVFRPSAGAWYIHQTSPEGMNAMTLGQTGDIPVAADFDGDGRADAAVFRPSNGTWYYVHSSDSTTHSTAFGTNGDKPAAADYTGDGRAEIAVYRPSTGTWYFLDSTTGAVSAQQFGSPSDVPVPADFNGDGRADIVVYRPLKGTWYLLLPGVSATGAAELQFSAIRFGLPEDKPAPGDFDGDGTADITVFRPSTGTWYHLSLSTGGFSAMVWGAQGDIPLTGDYDGDGIADHGVFRPTDGNWYLMNSTAGYSGTHFGMNGDIPVPAVH
jgi:hypothetical protein